jgi:hypothetical protein
MLAHTSHISDTEPKAQKSYNLFSDKGSVRHTYLRNDQPISWRFQKIVYYSNNTIKLKVSITAILPLQLTTLLIPSLCPLKFFVHITQCSNKILEQCNFVGQSPCSESGLLGHISNSTTDSLDFSSLIFVMGGLIVPISWSC